MADGRELFSQKGDRMLTSEKVLRIYRNAGALLEGHFRLRSGKHSSIFLQTAAVLQYPEYAAALCGELASRTRVEQVDVVIGPAIGGVIMAYETARELGARALFGEKKDQGMFLRPGFDIQARERVLVVDDVLTTGGSIRKIIDLVHANDASVISIACFIDRSKGTVKLGVPIQSLATLDIPNYEVADCPLCAEGVELVEP